METIEKLHKSIDFIKFNISLQESHWKCKFWPFHINVLILFDEIKSKIIKLADTEKKSNWVWIKTE